MRIPLAFGLLSLAFSSCSTPPEPATKLRKAAVLPLEINDKFQFRKIKQAFFQPIEPSATKASPSILNASGLNGGRWTATSCNSAMETITQFFWRTSEQADVTVRHGIPPGRPGELCDGNGTLLSAGERLLQIGVQHRR